MNKITNKIKIEGATWRMLVSVDDKEIWRICYPTSKGFKPVLEGGEEIVQVGNELRIIAKKNE